MDVGMTMTMTMIVIVGVIGAMGMRVIMIVVVAMPVVWLIIACHLTAGVNPILIANPVSDGIVCRTQRPVAQGARGVSLVNLLVALLLSGW